MPNPVATLADNPPVETDRTGLALMQVLVYTP